MWFVQILNWVVCKQTLSPARFSFYHYVSKGHLHLLRLCALLRLWRWPGMWHIRHLVFLVLLITARCGNPRFSIVMQSGREAVWREGLLLLQRRREEEQLAGNMQAQHLCNKCHSSPFRSHLLILLSAFSSPPTCVCQINQGVKHCASTSIPP